MLALVVAVVLFTSYTAAVEAAAVEAAAVEAAAALGSRTTTSLAKIAKDVLDHIQIEKEKTSLYFTTLKDRVEDIYRTMTHGRQDSVTIGDEIRTSVDLALEYMAFDDWELLGKEDEIEVWVATKRIATKGISKEIDRVDSGGGQGGQYPCVKSHTVLDMPVGQLLNILLDSSKLKALNENSLGRKDVHILNKYTKIVHTRVKVPLSKPHDFCVLMHARTNPISGNKHSKMLVSKSVVHELAPETESYTRSRILLGLNILTPCGKDGKKTDYVSYSHIQYVGIPPFIVSKSAYVGTRDYTKKFKAYCCSRGR